MWLTSLFLLLTLVNACGKDKDEPKVGPDPSGTWQVCELSESVYLKTVYSFSGADLNISIGSHGTAQCTDAAYEVSKVSASYELVKAEKHATGASPLNMTTKDVTLAFGQDVLAQVANNKVVCGISTWTLNTAVSLNGKTCTGAYAGLNELIVLIGSTKGMYYLITDNTIQFVDKTTDQLDATVYTKQ